MLLREKTSKPKWVETLTVNTGISIIVHEMNISNSFEGN